MPCTKDFIDLNCLFMLVRKKGEATCMGVGEADGVLESVLEDGAGAPHEGVMQLDWLSGRQW